MFTDYHCLYDVYSLIASIFNQPTHGRYEGDVECWASDDHGLFWEYRSTPTQHEPYTVRMNHAAGVSKNGDLIVLCGGWDNIRLELNEESYPIEMSLSISKNGGGTWERGSVDLPPVEAAMLHLGKGKWLAASRWFGYTDLDIHTSSDDGFTWTHVTVLGIPSVSAVHLLKLSYDRILLSYGNRSAGNKGIDIRVSNNEEQSWSTPQRVLDLKETNDLGYPAAVELSNGHIMIAYYSSGIQQHGRYHMGIVNFLLDELIVRYPE